MRVELLGLRHSECTPGDPKVVFERRLDKADFPYHINANTEKIGDLFRRHGMPDNAVRKHAILLRQGQILHNWDFADANGRYRKNLIEISLGNIVHELSNINEYGEIPVEYDLDRAVQNAANRELLRQSAHALVRYAQREHEPPNLVFQEQNRAVHEFFHHTTKFPTESQRDAATAIGVSQKLIGSGNWQDLLTLKKKEI